ncbi:hypothetical protein RF11_09952 [Thelohanellus kitauei]|uniref:Integrase zinc-binding domain-containing protein n=1 Tax=Thelohanellus kitauei TaxID=669202 RepID=A0A0C2MP53_THEKT|nr:hypothetical protein RF11_09952 [Thelohanellus kitauei]
MKLIESDKPIDDNTIQSLVLYKPIWKSLKKFDGLLFRCSKKASVSVFPKHLIENMFNLAQAASASYLGFEKTTNLLSRSAYWPGMNDIVSDWIHKCQRCSLNKTKNFTPRSFPKPMLISQDSHFWEVDFTARIHSDQGTQFESEIFQLVCKRFRISKSRTTPYHPFGNAELTFGQNLKTPLNVELPDNTTFSRKNELLPHSLYFQNLKTTLDESFFLANKRLELNNDRKVMVKNQRANKLEPVFNGVYKKYRKFIQRRKISLHQSRLIIPTWYKKTENKEFDFVGGGVTEVCILS